MIDVWAVIMVRLRATPWHSHDMTTTLAQLENGENEVGICKLLEAFVFCIHMNWGLLSFLLKWNPKDSPLWNFCGVSVVLWCMPRFRSLWPFFCLWVQRPSWELPKENFWARMQKFTLERCFTLRRSPSSLCPPQPFQSYPHLIHPHWACAYSLTHKSPPNKSFSICSIIFVFTLSSQIVISSEQESCLKTSLSWKTYYRAG